MDGSGHSCALGGGGAGQAGPRPRGATVSAMSESLRLTIVYEDAGDGWVGARIPPVRGAISQGQTRAQARENVIDALREVLAVRSARRPSRPSSPTPTRSS